MKGEGTEQGEGEGTTKREEMERKGRDKKVVQKMMAKVSQPSLIQPGLQTQLRTSRRKSSPPLIILHVSSLLMTLLLLARQASGKAALHRP